MTDPRDPTRLRDLDPTLRQAFDLARNEQPSTATVDAMIRAVEQATVGPSLPKLGLLKSQAVKLLVIVGVSSGLLWTLPSLHSRATDPAPPAAAPEPSSSPGTREPSEPGMSPEPLEPMTASDRSDRVRSTSEARQERARRPARARRHDAPRGMAAASPAGDPDVRGLDRESDGSSRASEQGAAERRQSIDELTLLEEAQRALRNSPDRALELTAQHEREYPDGQYVQEREQIAIEALFNAGRSSAMRARAERFRRTFPGSAHNARIADLLELQP